MAAPLRPRTLSETDKKVRANELFNKLRENLLAIDFPPSLLYDLENDPEITCWSDYVIVTGILRNLLPFGRILVGNAAPNFPYLVPGFLNAARRQLYYWRLADATTPNNEPVEILVLSENCNNFWGTVVPSERSRIVDHLLSGSPIYFLTKFFLSYTEVQLAFHEICLIHPNPPNTSGLVITDGVVHTHRWEVHGWETEDLAQD